MNSNMQSPYIPAHLRCEYISNPLGIDVASPRLSWMLGQADVTSLDTVGQAASMERGIKQSAYQILVASSVQKLDADQGDLWDSGKVVSSQSVHVEYKGAALQSRRRYWWKVRVWVHNDQVSAWSEPAWWEMGLLDRSDWQAEWIGASVEPGEGSQPCPYLRTEFSLRGPVRSARVYVSARGLYELWLNGKRVGEDLFTPGWTDYGVRIQYQTYDVGAYLQQGGNVIGAILGDGWHSGYLAWAGNRAVYGKQPQLMAQLVIEYEDHSIDTISTDEQWQWKTGPILASDIYNGESYDARLEMAGWSEVGFKAEGWQPVKRFAAPEAVLNASASPRVRRIMEISPISVTEQAPGVFIYDLGQNMVGWVRLKVKGPQGTTVTLRFAEVLNTDGSLYTENLRSARCTDTYTLRGGEAEVFEPHFTFHGFRYVEITGYPGKPGPDAVTGVVIHSDTPPTGSFECSNPMLNQLQHNITWGQRGNFLEVPTDCPQRDERLGWTGDAQVFVRTASYNMEVAGFFTKWLVDLTDAQSKAGAFPSVAPDVIHKKERDGGPAWADAGIVCPWTIYLCYGDTAILRRHYEAMKRYITYLLSVDHSTRNAYGDWLNIDDPTPKDLISVAFTAYSLALMINIAEVLGREQDAVQFRRQLQQVKAEFNNEYVTPNGRLVAGSQTAYVLALHFDLLPGHLRKQAVERLVKRIHEKKDHLSTGFVGTPYLLSVLSENGYQDLAYKLLLNKDYPSWGYPIAQGSTTMWERWDSYRHDKGFQSPSMNSFNHYAYGAVGDWMYRNIAGIDTDAKVTGAGYKRFRIAPLPGGDIQWAKAGLRTMYGQISVRWQIADGLFTLEVAVPPNTEAEVVLPAARLDDVRESGKPIGETPGVSSRVAHGAVVCEVGSGVYRFAMVYPGNAGNI